MAQTGRTFLQPVVICLFLVGCGGGNHSDTTQTPPPPPPLPAPAIPANLQISSHDGYTQLQWDNADNATAYNIYWSTQPGVNKSNSHKIHQTSNRLTHGGLINDHTYYYVVAAENKDGEGDISAEASGTPVAGTGTDDPLFGDQWHLRNTGQAGGSTGEDLDVVPVWNSCADNSCRGEGVRIAVVDDGLEIAHPDLLANVATGLGHNYSTGSTDPTPTNPIDAHGTAVAGIIAARDLNDRGVRGVAPRANLVGYNLLQNFTLVNEADAMSRGSPDIQISSNSWGNPDGTGELDATALSWKTAIDTGLSTGRNGLGTIYVFAGGNGGTNAVDNSNYDGYTNYRGIIAVAALNDTGQKASYSEEGANLLVSAFGGEFCDTHTITSTDLSGTAGFNTNNTVGDYANRDYTKCMNGTSSAAPMVSGTVALMLQANPKLGWRDVRYILATTARQNDSSDTDWVQNGANIWVNHKYGFGAVDAAAAVDKAKTWTNLGPVLTKKASQVVNKSIPDNNATGISDTITISNSGINKIDTVEVTFRAANHPYPADLAIVLTSPDGTESVLAQTHVCYDPYYNTTVACQTRYDNWTFSSVRDLDEAANGDWTLTVKDGAASDTGTFQSWKLKIDGRAN